MNRLYDEIGFVAVRTRSVVFHVRSVGVFRPQFFLESFRIIRDYLIRKRKYLFRRTIVLFEFISLYVRKIFLKIENVREVSAAPTVNTLILVADYENVAMLRSQYLDYIVLDFVSVLKLVDVNISEFILIVLTRFVVGFK